MSSVDNVNDDKALVNNNIEYEMQMKKIREEVAEKLIGYRKTLSYMAADVPLSVLCLNPHIESALVAHGCLRVYDLLDLDFTKVKGLGIVRIRNLTARLDEFLSML